MMTLPGEGLTVIKLERFLALEDVEWTDRWGRTQILAKGRGGHFDPAAVQHLVQGGKMQRVPDQPSPPHGFGAPAPGRRYNP
jgi:hypothetical protein